MCLYSDEKPTLEIAQEDIITFKWVNIRYKHRTLLDRLLFRKKIQCYMAPMYMFIYIPGEIHETTLDSFVLDWSGTCFKSGRGFYSLANKNKRINTNVRCIIPKGARYYRVFSYYYMDYVYISSQIIIAPMKLS